MERARGHLVCDKCSKEAKYVNEARWCMFCGGEYSGEAIFLAGQEAHHDKLISKWSSLFFLVAIVYALFLFPVVDKHFLSNLIGGPYDGITRIVILTLSFLLIMVIGRVVSGYRAKKLYPLPKQDVSKSP